MKEHEKSIASIENDMARSRAEIELAAETLKSKMDPENLAEAARQVISEGTERVEARVKEIADSAAPKLVSLGDQAVDYLHRNPIPTLIAGIGAALLITLSEKEKEQPRVASGNSLPRPDHHPRLTRMQKKTIGKVRRVNLKHPLILGAAVFGSGVMLGSLLPHTRREDELLGPCRDSLLEESKGSVQDALELTETAMNEELEEREAEATDLAHRAEKVTLSPSKQVHSNGFGEANNSALS